MTEGLVANMVSLGMLAKGDAQAPLREEISANPHDDEVIIFHDSFVVGLRFAVDPALVEIHRLYSMHMLS
jgi:hypothetical protein